MAPFERMKRVDFRPETEIVFHWSTQRLPTISKCQHRRGCTVSVAAFAMIVVIQILLLCISVLGDPRTNQNPVILAFGILMFRWHNVLAKRVHSEHPDWSDEDIFQRTRRLVIASLQVSTNEHFFVYIVKDNLKSTYIFNRIFVPHRT